MKTLIELYDERPIENVLASEVFRPERTIMLATKGQAENAALQRSLERYFRHLGLETRLVFAEAEMYRSADVEEKLRVIIEQYPDCMVDITGGTDAALFACGTVCRERNVPAITYSRKKNSFFGIHNAPFDGALPCEVRHTVEDCFLMAGGALRSGRVDNSRLDAYAQFAAPFFSVYQRHKPEWVSFVKYMQTVSRDLGDTLAVDVPRTVHVGQGRRVSAPETLLRELAQIGFLKDLSLGEHVCFAFRDKQVRFWLCDIGSVLELYIYFACKHTGLFDDVMTSAVVSWEGSFRRDDVVNEIDVMAMRGITPVFISCKTCRIATEALNELAILRDRFGGKGAKAVIVTSQRVQTVTRHRASELDIEVIDASDLRAGVEDVIKGIIEKD